MDLTKIDAPFGELDDETAAGGGHRRSQDFGEARPILQ